VGSDTMDIFHYGISGLDKAVCKLDGTLHVQLMFPGITQPAWTIAAGDEWKFIYWVHKCSGGFTSIEWTGINGQLPAGLTLSLKKRDNSLTPGGKDLSVVVCSASDAACNKLPAKTAASSSSRMHIVALPVILSFIGFILFKFIFLIN